jgi:hypothetical protein
LAEMNSPQIASAACYCFQIMPHVEYTCIGSREMLPMSNAQAKN